MKREPPLVKILPRQPGTKEARYAHLLSGDVVEPEGKSEPAPQLANHSADGDRVSNLEKEVEALKDEIADLKQQFAAFRKQFE